MSLSQPRRKERWMEADNCRCSVVGETTRRDRVFPNTASDLYGDFCDSYETIGQHFCADYFGIVQHVNPCSLNDCGTSPTDCTDRLPLRPIGGERVPPRQSAAACIGPSQHFVNQPSTKKQSEDHDRNQHQATIQFYGCTFEPQRPWRRLRRTINAVRSSCNAISMVIGAIWTTKTSRPMNWPLLTALACSVLTVFGMGPRFGSLPKPPTNGDGVKPQQHCSPVIIDRTTSSAERTRHHSDCINDLFQESLTSVPSAEHDGPMSGVVNATTVVRSATPRSEPFHSEEIGPTSNRKDKS